MYTAIRSYRQAVFVALNRTFHLSIDRQIFAAENLALNAYILAKRGRTTDAGLGVKSSRRR
jgi:hypothetical protein